MYTDIKLSRYHISNTNTTVHGAKIYLCWNVIVLNAGNIPMPKCPRSQIAHMLECPWGQRYTCRNVYSAKMSVPNASWRNGRCEIRSSQSFIFFAEINFLQFLHESGSKIILSFMQICEHVYLDIQLFWNIFCITIIIYWHFCYFSEFVLILKHFCAKRHNLHSSLFFLFVTNTICLQNLHSFVTFICLIA